MKTQFQKFKYIDSSEEEQEQKQEKKQCKFLQNQLSKQYEKEIKKMLSMKVQSDLIGKGLLLDPTESEAKHSLLKRNENYNYFIEKIKIDEKYHEQLKSKAEKLSQINQKKKEKLYMKKAEEICRTEENQMKSYFINKEGKEQKVIKGLNQFVRKLGVEKIVNKQKQVRSQIEQKRKVQKDQLATLENKQRNQLTQLYEKYEQAKVEKRINKLDQQKAVKDLKNRLQERKKGLKEKTKIKNDFVI